MNLEIKSLRNTPAKPSSIMPDLISKKKMARSSDSFTSLIYKLALKKSWDLLILSTESLKLCF